ncbi:MAG TPA: glycosyltransferase [Candidatus Elarobacter sp.]
MNVVHIGEAAFGGGAAHAMVRLHRSLQRRNVESRLVVRRGAASGDADATVPTRGDADGLASALRDAVVRQYVELNRTTLTNTHYSLEIDGADVSRLPIVASSDVVHLHWTGAFQAPSDVAALLDAKPVVWTLHDFAPLTGGCHFPAGCERYGDDCGTCPQLVRDPFRVVAATLADKQQLWAQARPTFIAPSRYIADRARRSAVVRASGASVVHIPHGIDVEVFRPRPKVEARNALGLPADGVVVLCGSNHNGELRKGAPLVERVLGAVAARAGTGPALTILTVGDPPLDLDGIGVAVVHLGRVGAETMPSVYAAADLFVHASLEDNFPGMLLESLACGTPAVAFDAGGVADIVEDGQCGRLVAVGDERALEEAVVALIDDPERRRRMGEGARVRVTEHFDDRAIARRHAELYAAVVAGPPERRAGAAGSRRATVDAIYPRLAAACQAQELADARARAAQLAEDARTQSQYIAQLEAETARLEATVEVQGAEIELVHRAAADREELIEALHRIAASREKHPDVAELEAEIAQLKATISEQAAEIKLVHRAAADRQQLIEDLDRAAKQREAVIDELRSRGGVEAV